MEQRDRQGDRIVSLKDWIDSFWNFQEEDIKYFQDLISKKVPLDPGKILNDLRERMQMRKIFYQIYKYLPKKDIAVHEAEWAEQKLMQIVYREELITNMVNKILEILSIIIEPDIEPEMSHFNEDNFILH